MKILTDDRVSAIAATTGALGTHTTDLVQNDRPRQAFISTSIEETLTFTLTCDSTHPADGFFVHGGLFDSATWDLQTTGGSSIESGTLSVVIAGQSNLPSNPNTRNVFFLGTSNFLKPEFVSFTTPQTSNCKILITMLSDVDRRDYNTQGNSIATWVKDTATSGHFEDSNSDPVNVINHGFVFVGSQLKVAGDLIASTTVGDVTVTTDSIVLSTFTVSSGDTVTVNSGFTLTVTEFLYSQITAIVGDGTSTGAITLSNDVSNIDVAELINPVKLGIFRCGTFLDLPNPQAGITRQLIDYSVQRPTINGGMTNQNRNVGQSVDFNIMATNAEAVSIEDFARTFRSKPFAILWAASMATAQDEKTRYSGFFYLSGFPQFTLLPRANYQSIDIQLTEIV